ncbi:MAG: hypothetical protein OXI81_02410 [Paracoccaceae bacterium]|nr:hypothetical protein [Paracoccaceae bacterium]
MYSEFGQQLHERLFVGIHQGDEHLGSLPSIGQRGSTKIRYGRLNDGVGATTVAAYLEAGLLSDRVVRRHASPPVLRVNGTAESHHLDALVRSVQLVNASLPADWKITILPDSGDHDSAIIEVDFVPSLAAGAGVTHYYIDRASPGQPSLDRARIEIDRNVMDAAPIIGERLVQQVLAHEIVHALGVLDHLPTRFDTIMESDNPGPSQGIEQPLSILYPADREALRALYGRLANGDSPAADLGPWTSASLHIAGNGRHANFGVAMRNGYAEAWAHGYHPGEFCCDFSLGNNPALSGSVTWNGVLLGLTPDAAAVAGDAAISVNIASMTGRADFTGLETWNPNAAPGAVGTGATWLDGDLGYTIAVRGNTFRETGGDAGTLTGIFTGRAHDGAAGTLERSDLTAAFGASR